MSSGVHIERVQALRDLNTAICEFSQFLEVHLSATLREINEVIEWIAERERFWHREVEKCMLKLRQAQQAYATCMAQERTDDKPISSCSAEAHAVRIAEKELSQARQELQNVIRWKSAIENAVRNYMAQANRVRNLANQTLSQASSFLRSKVARVDRYASRAMPAPSHVSAFGTHGYSYHKAKQEMLLRALDDPLISRYTKGWIRNELRRIRNVKRAVAEGRPVEHPYSINIRMPPGLDAGHRIPRVDTAANLRFEDIYLNRSRWHRARKLGLEDRIR